MLILSPSWLLWCVAIHCVSPHWWFSGAFHIHWKRSCCIIVICLNGPKHSDPSCFCVGERQSPNTSQVMNTQWGGGICFRGLFLQEDKTKLHLLCSSEFFLLAVWNVFTGRETRRLYTALTYVWAHNECVLVCVCVCGCSVLSCVL